MKKSITLLFVAMVMLMCGCEKNDGDIFVYADPMIEFVDESGTNLFAFQTCEEWIGVPLDCEYRFINHQGANEQLMLRNISGHNYVYYWRLFSTDTEGFTRTAKLTSEFIFGDSESHEITCKWGLTDDGLLHCTQFTLDGKDCYITYLKDVYAKGLNAAKVTVVVNKTKAQ